MKIMKQGFGISIRKKSKLNTTNIHRYSIPYLVDRIIEQADIILEILDARFIEETRNIHIENEAKKLGKIVIYVLNKSDLVDVNKLKRNKEFTELNPIISLKYAIARTRTKAKENSASSICNFCTRLDILAKDTTSR